VDGARRQPEDDTMRHLFSFAAAIALLALAGCYTADKPMISDENAATPYAKITFKARGEDDAPTVLTLAGRHYVARVEDTDVMLRFLALPKANWFVAEMSATDGGEEARLYGLINVADDAKTAYGYATVGGPKDAGPGLRACKDGICIDDLDAYVRHANAIVDAGARPDVTYDITVE
jgi:hypothetical protein